MQIEVRLFGGLTEHARASRITVDLDAPADVADLRAAIAAQHPPLAPLLGGVKIAINLEVAADDSPVPADAQVALLPPVAGGADDLSDTADVAIRTGLVTPPIDVASALAAVSGPDVGGTAIFLGTVRDHAPDLDGVVGLDYSAYPEMAEKVLADLATEITTDHPEVRGIALLHAVGELDVGDHTILIVCAAAHRAPAFAACQDALERVKDHTPIWKRERTADGNHRWVGLADPSATADTPPPGPGSRA
ncbi:MAG: molybdenum cofactor biosynthesis protein MoaE [Nitriliruptor sp.]|nr:MAG: molybdenum cofactor biosynthesis protein MoaE [Nitriliruptor sp.]